MEIRDDGVVALFARAARLGPDVAAHVAATTNLVASAAKALAPSRDNELRGGIVVDLSAVETEYEGRVLATAPHSPYVEFGTGSRVSVPPGLDEYAMRFYVNGQGRMPARPFLFPAAEGQRARYVEGLREIVARGGR